LARWVGLADARRAETERLEVEQRRVPYPVQAPQRVEEPARGRQVPPLRVELGLRAPQVLRRAKQGDLPLPEQLVLVPQAAARPPPVPRASPQQEARQLDARRAPPRAWPDVEPRPVRRASRRPAERRGLAASFELL
jgi:uncharacterized membrane protein